MNISATGGGQAALALRLKAVRPYDPPFRHTHKKSFGQNEYFG